MSADSLEKQALVQKELSLVHIGHPIASAAKPSIPLRRSASCNQRHGFTAARNRVGVDNFEGMKRRSQKQ
jgi:hypothetical protein